MRKDELLAHLEIYRAYHDHFAAVNEETTRQGANDAILVHLRRMERNLGAMTRANLNTTLERMLGQLDAEVMDLGMWSKLELRLFWFLPLRDLLKRAIETNVQEGYFVACDADAVMGRGLRRLAAELSVYRRMVEALPDQGEVSPILERAIDNHALVMLTVIWGLKYSVSGKSESFYFTRRKPERDIVCIFGGASLFNERATNLFRHRAR